MEKPLYLVLNNIRLVLFFLFGISVAGDLKEAVNDFYRFGDDIVAMLGVFMVWTKLMLHRTSAKDIEPIVNEFVDLDLESRRRFGKHPQYNYWQCRYFMFDSFFCTIYNVMVVTLFVAMSSTPLFNDQIFPFRAKYPFGWDIPEEHPIMYVVLYVYQSSCILYLTVSVNLMDNLICNIFSNTSLNLKVLTLRIREMGSSAVSAAENPALHEEQMKRELEDIVKQHQRIIRLVDYSNLE